MDECNLNFRAKQATMYQDGQQTNSIVGDAFDQFLTLQAIIEKACEKTPEQVEKEKAEQIAIIDLQIASLQASKESLTKGKIEPI